MRKLKVLMLLGVALLIVACGPVRPKIEATDESIEKSLAWLAEGLEQITEEEGESAYAKSSEESEGKVLTIVRELKVEGSKTILDVDMTIVVDGDVTVANGSFDMKYDAKSAIFLIKDLTFTDGTTPTYSGEVWYIPSSGNGFVATSAEHLEVFYDIGLALF